MDAGLASATDSAIWHFANQNELIVISKDEDFLYLATRLEGKARLIWVRLGNCRNHVLLATFESSWPRMGAWGQTPRYLAQLSQLRTILSET